MSSVWVQKCKERRAAGLCSKCDSPPVPGRSNCQHHLDIDARAAQRVRKVRASFGVCIKCGDNRARGDKLYCKQHRELQRQAEHRYAVRHRGKKIP